MSEPECDCENVSREQDRAASEFMYENMIPFCGECLTTRDLIHCDDCTDAGDGMWPFCRPCLVIYGGHDCDPASVRNIPSDYRFTHYC